MNTTGSKILTVLSGMLVFASLHMVLTGCSKDASVAPDEVTPPKPENLSYRRTAFHEVEMTWAESGGAPRSYLIERSRGLTQSFVERGSVPGTQRSFLDTFAVYSTYEYRVTPVTDAGKGTSLSLGAVNLNDPRTDTVLVDEVASCEYQIGWYMVPPGMTGFLVGRSTNGGPYGIISVQSSYTPIRETLREYGQYLYGVQTFLGHDTTAARFSAIKTISSPYVTNFTVAFQDEEILALSWSTTNPFASAFVIEKSTVPGVFTAFANVPLTTVSLRDTARCLGTYQYRLHAIAGTTRSTDLLSNTMIINGWFPGKSKTYIGGGGNVVPLPSGNLLYYGIGGAEVYRWQARSWEPIAAPASEEIRGQAVIVSNGKVLNIGGVPSSTPGASPDYRNDLFDPFAETWTRVANLNTSLLDETYLRVIGLQDGSAVVVGATKNMLNHEMLPIAFCEIYNPGSASFQTRSALPTCSQSFGASLITGGRILVTGGKVRPTDAARDSCWIFDPVGNTWTEAARMSSPRNYPVLVSMQNGTKVLLLGSQSELYDAPSNHWDYAPSPATYLYAWTKVDEDTLYLIGGNMMQPDKFYRYIASGNRWEIVADFPGERLPIPVSLHRLTNGRFLAIDNQSNRTEVYVPGLL